MDELEQEVRTRAENMWKAINDKPFDNAPLHVQYAFLNAARTYFYWIDQGVCHEH